MRNKFGIIALLIALVVFFVYMLSFTFVSRGLEKEAVAISTNKDGTINARKKQAYLDSIWTEPVYNLGIAKYTYKDVKENELNLGLDLQGGMYVVMEVSPVEIIKALASNNTNAKFMQALSKAKAAQAKSQSKFSQLFYKAFQETAPGEKLSTIFSNQANKGKITYQSTDGDILKIIDKEIEDAIDRSLYILRTRIDKFGAKQPNIQRLGNSSRIQIELPGVDDPKRVRKLLSGIAKLEFWEVYEPQEYFPYLQQIDNYLTAKEKLNKNNFITKTDSLKRDTTGGEAKTDVTKTDSTKSDLADILKGKNAKKDTSKVKSDSTKKNVNTSVISRLFDPRALQAGILRAFAKDTSKINSLLEEPNLKAILPGNLKFLWAVKGDNDDKTSDKKNPFITLYAIKKGIDGKAPLEGDVITNASGGIDPKQRSWEVSMNMDGKGARQWKKLTGANINRKIAIVLDNLVYSAPTVNGEIPNGSSSISGNFTQEEATDLANVLKTGRLPAPISIVEESVIGPTLGQEAIQQGLMSIFAGFAAIILFMIIYYNNGGLIANIAVLINLFLIIGILASMGAVLTLPGIAGMVLTVGMAVDANVLINERIKEELRAGRPLDVALRNGYGVAQITILDANITVAMAGIVLFFFGSGPVQGFATTLLIGIFTSLFTSVLVTRIISEWAIEKKLNLKFTTALSRNLFVDFHYNFINKRKIAYVVSSVLIVAGLVSLFTKGLDYGVDFKGGWSYIVQFDKPMNTSEVGAALGKPFNGVPEVKTFGALDKLKITTTYLIENDEEGTAAKVEEKLNEGLRTLKANYKITGTSKVGPTIADDIRKNAVWSIALALVLIFAYIWIRFRRWEYAMGATIALFHDALIVITFFTLCKGLFPFSLDVDQNFIAAILTIVGYSVNDTVVIFDRIRENIRNNTGTDNVETVVNRALTETFSRSIVTAFTVFVVVVLLAIFGGPVLRGMSIALMIGVISGSYSTLYIAVPFLVDVVKEDLLTKKPESPVTIPSAKGKITMAKK